MRKLCTYNFFFLIICITAFYGCKPVIIDGYADHISCFPGDSLTLYIHAQKSVEQYPLCFTDLDENIYAHFPTNLFPQKTETNKPYQQGFGYLPTARVQIPYVPSGIYNFGLAIPIVVKSRLPTEIVVVYSSNTEHAYNNAGGKSLYDYNSSNQQRSYEVSFYRPMDLPLHSTAFLREFAGMKDSMSVGYVCDQDLDNYGCINDAKLLIIPGHSEYWTRKARENVDRFVEAGGNVLILSGNTMWWQVRYSSNGNSMVCYKSYKDPISDTLLKTTNWTKPELDFPILPSIGLDFDHGGFGKNEDKGWDGFKIVNQNSPLLEGTSLEKGDVITVPSDEYDGAVLRFNEDSSEVRLLNTESFFRYELIGYDLCSRLPGSNGAWIVMQKSPNSGIVINVGSTDWCSESGIHGQDGETIQIITRNMIQALQKNQIDQIFSRN